MLESLTGYDSQSPVKECYSDTLIANLRRKKLRAEADLAAVNAALDALEKNPEVANILELISKAR
jgi:hypothetical protein